MKYVEMSCLNCHNFEVPFLLILRELLNEPDIILKENYMNTRI